MMKLILLILALQCFTIHEVSAQTYKPNLIINGDMAIDQRGSATTAITIGVGGTSSSYIVDRFAVVSTLTLGTGIATQITVPSTSIPYYQSLQYAMSLSVPTTGFSNPAINQNSRVDYRIEGYDFDKIRTKAVTLSFWSKIKHASSADFPLKQCLNFRNATGTSSYTTAITYAVSDTWYEFSIPYDLKAASTLAAFPSTNLLSAYITWTLVAGTNYATTTANSWVAGGFYHSSCTPTLLSSAGDTFQLTGVRLTEGTQKLPFVRAGGGSIAAETKIAERYYECLDRSYLSANEGSAAWDIPIFFKTEKRVSTWAIESPDGGALTGLSCGTSTGNLRLYNLTANSYITCTGGTGTISKSGTDFTTQGGYLVFGGTSISGALGNIGIVSGLVGKKLCASAEL